MPGKEIPPFYLKAQDPRNHDLFRLFLRNHVLTGIYPYGGSGQAEMFTVNGHGSSVVSVRGNEGKVSEITIDNSHFGGGQETYREIHTDYSGRRMGFKGIAYLHEKTGTLLLVHPGVNTSYKYAVKDIAASILSVILPNGSPQIYGVPSFLRAVEIAVKEQGLKDNIKSIEVIAHSLGTQNGFRALHDLLRGRCVLGRDDATIETHASETYSLHFSIWKNAHDLAKFVWSHMGENIRTKSPSANAILERVRDAGRKTDDHAKKMGAMMEEAVLIFRQGTALHCMPPTFVRKMFQALGNSMQKMFSDSSMSESIGKTGGMARNFLLFRSIHYLGKRWPDTFSGRKETNENHQASHIVKSLFRHRAGIVDQSNEVFLERYPPDKFPAHQAPTAKELAEARRQMFLGRLRSAALHYSALIFPVFGKFQKELADETEKLLLEKKVRLRPHQQLAVDGANAVKAAGKSFQQVCGGKVEKMEPADFVKRIILRDMLKNRDPGPSQHMMR